MGSFRNLHLCHILVIVADIDAGVIGDHDHPVTQADSLELVSIAVCVDLGLPDVLVGPFDYFFRQVVIVVDLSAHLEEILLGHLALVLGVVLVGVEDDDSIGESIHHIAVLEHRS